VSEYFGKQVSGADQFMSQDKFFVQKRAGSEYRPQVLQHKVVGSPMKRMNVGSASPTRDKEPYKDPDVWDPPTPKKEYGQKKVNQSAWAYNKKPT